MNNSSLGYIADGVQHAQDVDRHERVRNAENAARHATSSFTFDTTGVGSIILPTPLRFSVVFLEKPIISTGIEIVQLPDRSIYELPHATAGVMRWMLDDRWKNRDGTYSREHYLGAYVWARVWCDPVLDSATGKVLDQEAVDLNPPVPLLRHHMTAAGTAYKKLPDNITAGLIE